MLEFSNDNLKGNSKNKEKSQLDEVPSLHRFQIYIENVRVRSNLWNFSWLVKSVLKLNVLIRVKDSVRSQQLVAGWHLENTPTLVNIGIPILFHDPIHDFGVHYTKGIHLLHVIQRIVVC